jgi:hypothetical protein
MSLRIGLKGGLGNQLFQFAHGVDTALVSNLPILFYWDQVTSEINTPREFELNFLNIELDKYYRVYKDNIEGLVFKTIDHERNFLTLKKIHRQENFHFTKDLPIKKNRINSVSGYWQGEIFFKKNHVDIVKYINSNLMTANEFKTKHQKVAGIHLRFGDYYYSNKINEVHGVISIDYLKRATDLMLENGINTFHLYTDSLEISSEYIAKIDPVLNIEFMKLGTPLADLAGLSSHDSIIGSNSSFSWWASYLGYNKKKVILPRDWFSRSSLLQNSTVDLFKPEWITIGY